MNAFNTFFFHVKWAHITEKNQNKFKNTQFNDLSWDLTLGRGRKCRELSVLAALLWA